MAKAIVKNVIVETAKEKAAIEKAAELAAEQAKAAQLAAEQAKADALKGDGKKEDEEEMEIVLTEEDLQMNPELAEHGLKVGDTIKVPVESFSGKLSDQGHLTETMAPYLEAYPTEKEFHITSDGQVFLKANAADAVRHQKQLDDKEEVFVYVR